MGVYQSKNTTGNSRLVYSPRIGHNTCTHVNLPATDAKVATASYPLVVVKGYQIGHKSTMLLHFSWNSDESTHFIDERGTKQLPMDPTFTVGSKSLDVNDSRLIASRLLRFFSIRNRSGARKLKLNVLPTTPSLNCAFEVPHLSQEQP